MRYLGPHANQMTTAPPSGRRRPVVRVLVPRLLLTGVLSTCQFTGTALAQTLVQQVAERVNIARWENGELPPLKLDPLLASVAQSHSVNMAQRDFFMHCDPDTGTSPFTRMTQAGYAWTSAAENIAAGSATAVGVMNQWLNSGGHRANMLSTGNRDIGVGYAYQNPDESNVRMSNSGCSVTSSNGYGYQHYWTQKFGARSNVYPLVIAREAYRVDTCLVDVYLYGSGFATQMRLSNDGVNWSTWAPYAANTMWALQGAAGASVTVFSEIRNNASTVRAAQDSVVLQTACGNVEPAPPVLFGSGFE